MSYLRPLLRFAVVCSAATLLALPSALLPAPGYAGTALTGWASLSGIFQFSRGFQNFIRPTSAAIEESDAMISTSHGP